MIEFYKNTEDNRELKRLKSYSSGCFIKVIDPSEKEVKFLVDKFNLEIYNIQDGLDVDEPPRLEEDLGIIYIFLRIPRYNKDVSSTTSFLCILTKTDIITVSKDDLGMFDKISESKSFLTEKPTKCLRQILSYISKSYSLKVRQILKEVRKDKRNILNLKHKDILDLVLQEDILNDYQSSFSPLIDIHNLLLKIKTIRFREIEKEFIEDLVIDLNQTLNTCNSVRKTIANMRSYFQTALSNKLNRTLSILTVFTIFLTIPAVFSSIYGMNIDVPMQNNPNIFFILAGIIVAVWLILILFFREKISL